MVVDALAHEGIRTPRRQSLKGREYGGEPFARGQVYKILNNPIYVGEIEHRGQRYPAQHQPIIDRETWDEVQRLLAANSQGDRGANASEASLLAGKVVDEGGEPMIAAHACKGARRYRYYVSRHLQHGNGDQDGVRIPAREIEVLVCEQLASAMEQPLSLLRPHDLPVADIKRIARAAPDVVAALQRHDRATVRALTEQITVRADRVSITINSDRAFELLDIKPAASGDPIEIHAGASLTRSGRVVRLVERDGRASNERAPDGVLVKLIAKARGWWVRLCQGDIDIADLAEAGGITSSYATRILRLAFLAPAVVDAILAGKQLASIDTKAITLKMQIANDWDDQRQAMLPARAN